MSTLSPQASFSVSQARRLIADLFEHREAIYWADMIVTAAVGYGAAMTYLSAPNWSALQIVTYLVAGFALFRLGSFIHEIVHMPGRTLLRFRIGWNLLAGIPMLMPSFFYNNHIDHHSTRHYGTGQDGEYLPIGSGTLGHIARFYAQVLVLPLSIFIRFLLITPISFLHPRLRQWMLEHYSSYVINWRYRHHVPDNAPRHIWAWLEVACFLRAACLIGAVAIGMASLSELVKMYLLAIVALGLNYVRNLVAHRYESDGTPMSHVDQLSDSVNIRGIPILTELFFPLNLRYHALHHLYPTLPYHNLRAAHRRLMSELPADSLYRRSEYPGFASIAWDVLKRAAATSRKPADDASRVDQRWFANRRELLDDWQFRVAQRGRAEAAAPAASSTAPGATTDRDQPQRAA